MYICVMFCCVMPFCVMPFCVMPLCVILFYVMAICVMAICVTPLCVMPFCVMTVCVMTFCFMTFCFSLRYASLRDGHLQNRLVAIQLWIDAFMIWTILFQILIIEFCHRYTSIHFLPHHSVLSCRSGFLSKGKVQCSVNRLDHKSRKISKLGNFKWFSVVFCFDSHFCL